MKPRHETTSTAAISITNVLLPQANGGTSSSGKFEEYA